MSYSTLNQGSELSEIVNKRNKWLLCKNEISRYLVNNDDSLHIPSGRIWFSTLRAYPIYFYNFLKLLYFVIKQIPSKQTSFEKKSTHILFSTGAGYDLGNYRKFFHDSNVEVIELEAFNISQITNFNIVKIKSVFLLFKENLQEVRRILRLKIPQDLRKKIVNQTLPNLASYTYYCAFLSEIKEQIPNVKVFHSGAYLLSIAATRAGIETFYLLHGLMGKVGRASFPFFNHIYVYADEEKIYLKDISPNANVCLYPFKELSKLEKRAIVFLRQFDDDMSEKNLSELLNNFIQKDFEIYLKKHPSYKGTLVDKIASKYKLEVIDLEESADEIILNFNPSFTIGWMSTALCESLLHGVVPISLSEKEEINWTDQHGWIIYPIKKRTFSWKEEKGRIFELLADFSLYGTTVSELRTR